MPILKVEAEFEGPAFELFQAMTDLTKTFAHRYFRELQVRSPLNIQVVSDEQAEAEALKALAEQSVRDFPEIPSRVYNALGRVGLYKVGEIAGKKKEELRAIPSFGETSFRCLEAAFAARGLHPWS